MLIWYANLPEETVYFLKRQKHGWQYLFIALPVFKFLIPFFGLILQDLKRRERWLMAVCWVIIVGQFLDVYWMVMPTWSKTLVSIGWMELGIVAGFAGIFGLAVARFYATHFGAGLARSADSWKASTGGSGNERTRASAPAHRRVVLRARADRRDGDCRLCVPAQLPVGRAGRSVGAAFGGRPARRRARRSTSARWPRMRASPARARGFSTSTARAVTAPTVRATAPARPGLNPPPRNYKTEPFKFGNDIVSLHNTILKGSPGTSMPSVCATAARGHLGHCPLCHDADSQSAADYR